MDLGAQTPFTGTSTERLALDGLTNHRGRLFFETDTLSTYICDGLAWYIVGSVGSSNRLVNRTVTPAPDGIETVFTVQDNIYVAASLVVWLNGLVLLSATDFSETVPGSGTFTFSDPPLGGDIIVTSYCM